MLKLCKNVFAGLGGISRRDFDHHEVLHQAQVLEPPKSKRFDGKNVRSEISAGLAAVLDAQWRSMLVGLEEMVAKRKRELEEGAGKVDDVENLQRAAALGGTGPVEQVMRVCCDVAVDTAVRDKSARPVDLCNVICMADVSGSMSGTPMMVGVASKIARLS